MPPYFRLDVDTPAGGFFYAVYHFLGGEASDNGPKTPSLDRRPQPDPVPRHARSLAADYHQNHIHCEVAAA